MAVEYARDVSSPPMRAWQSSPSSVPLRWRLCRHICEEPRFPNTLNKARFPRVLYPQSSDARRRLCLPASAKADIPEIAEQSYGLVVLLRLFRGDQRLEFAPGFVLASGERRKVRLPRRRCLTVAPCLLCWRTR
jgi:hypothetical protein